jgi:hypothetical protein
VAARRIIRRVLRIEFDRLIEVGDGVVEVALRSVARRARKVSGALAVERDGFAEVLDRRVVVALLRSASPRWKYAVAMTLGLSRLASMITEQAAISAATGVSLLRQAARSCVFCGTGSGFGFACCCCC